MDYDDYINEIIDSYKPTGDYISDLQVLYELYETKFGIRNHITNGSAFGSVCFSEAENFTKGSLYELHLSNFIDKEIGKYLNMSFDDYMRHTRQEIRMFNRMVTKSVEKKSAAAKTLLSDLEDNGKN